MFGMSAVDVSLGLNEAVVIEDADAPVSTTIAGIITNSDVEPRITRNMISPNSRMSQRCTEKANNTDESDKDFSASIESRAVRQSTRSRTPRQTYQDEFHTESEQVSLMHRLYVSLI